MKIFTTIVVLLGILVIFSQENHAQVSNDVLSKVNLKKVNKINRLISKNVLKSSRQGNLKGTQNTIESLKNSYCSNSAQDTIVPNDKTPPVGAVDIVWKIITNITGDGEKDHTSDWSIYEGTGINKKLIFLPTEVQEFYYQADIWVTYVYVNATGNNIGDPVTDGTVVYDIPKVFDVLPDTAIICGGDTTKVIVDDSQTGVSYLLYRDGVFAYKQIGGKDNFPVEFSVTKEGEYTVLARTTGSSCSAMMNGSTMVIVHPKPTIFNFLPDTVHICIGDTADLTLESSETDMSYILYKDGTQVQGPVLGTGNELSFKVQEKGKYSVQAYNSIDNICTTMMNGSPLVIVHENPTITSVTNDSPACENSDVRLYSDVSGGSGVYKFAWSSNVGFADTLQNPIISNIKFSEAGYYKLIVTDSFGCFSKYDSTEVAVYENPKVVASQNDTV
jgi:plastocyanin